MYKTGKTKVIFRKMYPEHGGEVIAIFPELAGDSNPYRTCQSYQHTGQHGAITLDYARFTFPLVNSGEYEALKDELEAIGYELDVCARMSKKDLKKRIAECENNPVAL